MKNEGKRKILRLIEDAPHRIKKNGIGLEHNKLSDFLNEIKILIQEYLIDRVDAVYSIRAKPLIWHETEYGFVSEHGYYSIHFDAKAQGYFIKQDLQDLPDGFHTNVDRAKKACEYYYEQELLSRIEYV